MMGVVTILLGLAPAWAGARIVARARFRVPAGLPSDLAAMTLAWAWITAGMLVLGTTGWLGRGPLIAWSFAGLTVSLMARNRGKPSLRAEASGATEPLRVEAIIAIGLTLWAALILMLPSLLFPVKVVSDGPIYHLYFAARWWKAGRIFLIPTPFGESAAPYFPAVGDLWHTWLFVVWGGDRLARVGQFPFLIAASATVYALARRVGAGVNPSALAAAWFATVTPLLVFSFEPNVDTLFVAGYLLAVYFGASFFLDDGGRPLLILSGLAAGLAWGTKAPGVVFVPPLLLALAAGCLARRETPRRRLGNVGLIALVPLLMDGYWLVRNFLLTGNPLYPLRLEAFGTVWLRGWYGPGAMPTSPYYLPPGDWRAAIDLLLLVVDPRIAPLWMIAVAGVWRVGRARRGTDRVIWTCAALAVANVLLFWLVIPYRTQQRFFLHALGLAAVPLAVLFARRRWIGVLGAFVLALHLLTPQAWPLPSLHGRSPWNLSASIPNGMPSVIPLRSILEAAIHAAGPDRTWARISLAIGLGCVGLFALAGSRRFPAGVRRWIAGVGIVILGIGQGFSIYPSKSEAVRLEYPPFRDYFLGWLDLDSRTRPLGKRIAYAGTNLPYYLMGPDFRNEVRYVNVDSQANWLLHDYHREATALGLPDAWPDTRPGWDRARPDYESWLENLREARIDLLVVARANPAEGRLNVFDRDGFPIERSWADLHRDRFVLLYADPLFRTYGVRVRENPR